MDEKQIEGYPDYTIDTLGVVRFKGAKVKAYDNYRGYLKVFLYDTSHKKRSLRIHRLVAETFLENPNNLPLVNHKDGNKYNNTVENLEWVTHSRNVQLARDMHLPEIKPIVQINTKNGTIKGIYLSIRSCAIALKLDYRSLFEAVKKNTPYKGYEWKYCNITIRIDDAAPPLTLSRGAANV